MGYLTNFIVYTLAMTGVMMIALWVFKKSTCANPRGGTKYLKVIDTLSLGPRKILYIVSAGQEKFLIAGDTDRTALISKLNSQDTVSASSGDSFKQLMNDMQSKTPDMVVHKKQNLSTGMDKSLVGINSMGNTPYTSVMKNLAEKMRGGV